MKRLFILCFVLLSINVNAQSFQMGYKSPLVLNPAFTGISDFGRLNLTANGYKYPNSKKGKLNNYLGYDGYLSKYNSGVGLYTTNEFFSDFQRNSSVGLSYSYQGNIKNNWNYSAGAQFSFNQYFIDYDKIIMICTDICPTGPKTFNYYNLVLGGLVYSDKWFFGATYSFEDESNFNLGYTQHFKNIDDLSITGSVFLNSSYHGWTYFEIQSLVKYKMLYLGAKFGSIDTYGFQAGVDLYRFRLNYGFQYNASKLANNAPCFNEVSIQVKLPKTLKRNSAGFKHLLY